MELLERRRALVEERLVEVVDGLDPETLSSEVRHVTLSGGKRVRPMVTILACETVGGDRTDAVDFGVGIELFFDSPCIAKALLSNDKATSKRSSTHCYVLDHSQNVRIVTMYSTVKHI
ncbi:hypothetical protein EL22_28115 [Halostagnicola sp. A56]|nr:hypothetical protein EL22_28115 [Halostagnicola sp. A56]